MEKIVYFSFKLHFNNTWGHPRVSAFSSRQNDSSEPSVQTSVSAIIFKHPPAAGFNKSARYQPQVPGIWTRSVLSPGGTATIQARCLAPRPSFHQLIIHCIQMDSAGLRLWWRRIYPTDSLSSLPWSTSESKMAAGSFHSVCSLSTTTSPPRPQNSLTSTLMGACNRDTCRRVPVTHKIHFGQSEGSQNIRHSGTQPIGTNWDSSRCNIVVRD